MNFNSNERTDAGLLNVCNAEVEARTMLFAENKMPTAHRAIQAVSSHGWVYLAEAILLALFMVSACAFTVLFEYPDSPVHQAIPSSLVRRALIGVAMGLTAAA